MSDWIDATKRLPERPGEYIVMAATVGVTTADFHLEPPYRNQYGQPLHWDRWGKRLPGAVTHWMPLPTGPERLRPAGLPPTGQGRTDAMQAERTRLRVALFNLRSRVDARMGDTDPSDPDDPDLNAMRIASAALDATDLDPPLSTAAEIRGLIERHRGEALRHQGRVDALWAELLRMEAVDADGKLDAELSRRGIDVQPALTRVQEALDGRRARTAADPRAAGDAGRGA